VTGPGTGEGSTGANQDQQGMVLGPVFEPMGTLRWSLPLNLDLTFKD
jgi:hypothetical protein